MSQGSQQAITHVLQQDSKVLGALLNKLNRLAQINQILGQFLDAKLALNCQVANFEDNALTVITNNALWATQFRFQIPTLQTQLQKHTELAGLKNIVCKIVPVIGQREPHPLDAAPRTMPKLSLHSASIILDTAESIKHDRLRSIMHKIAKNTA